MVQNRRLQAAFLDGTSGSSSVDRLTRLPVQSMEGVLVIWLSFIIANAVCRYFLSNSDLYLLTHVAVISNL